MGRNNHRRTVQVSFWATMEQIKRRRSTIASKSIKGSHKLSFEATSHLFYYDSQTSLTSLSLNIVWCSITNPYEF